jgi:hypothetical protein
MLFTVNYVTLTRLLLCRHRLNLAEILVLFHIHFFVTTRLKIMRSLLPTFNLPSFVPQLRSSYMALMGRSEPTPQALNARTEVIREMMLQELGDYGEKKFPAVARRVRYAPDVQGLWYARSDVMAILANTYGETVAREKIANISGRFNGLLPKSLTGRIGFKIR